MAAREEPSALALEPVFGGMAHAHFNAAIVASLAHAYPDHQLRFAAERVHLGPTTASRTGAGGRVSASWGHDRSCAGVAPDAEGGLRRSVPGDLARLA